MKISIVIPAHNEERYLGRCLESVVSNRHTALHEIILVDNASSDNTALVASRFPGVLVVRESQKGLTRAREKGLAVSSGDVIAYVDADTEMPSGWLKTVYKEFSADSALMGLSGPYKFYDLGGLHRFAAAFFWRFLALPSYFLTGYMLVGGNFAVRREALCQIGGFDKRIEFYGEDTNIARRLSAVGKVKFKLSFFIYTSGRRLKGEGTFKTGLLYAVNFLSEVFIKRPVTKTYKDIR